MGMNLTILHSLPGSLGAYDCLGSLCGLQGVWKVLLDLLIVRVIDQLLLEGPNHNYVSRIT